MTSQDDLFGLFSKLYDIEQETEMSLEDYLKCCAREPMVQQWRRISARHNRRGPAIEGASPMSWCPHAKPYEH